MTRSIICSTGTRSAADAYLFLFHTRFISSQQTFFFTEENLFFLFHGKRGARLRVQVCYERKRVDQCNTIHACFFYSMLCSSSWHSSNISTAKSFLHPNCHHHPHPSSAGSRLNTSASQFKQTSFSPQRSVSPATEPAPLIFCVLLLLEATHSRNVRLNKTVRVHQGAGLKWTAHTLYSQNTTRPNQEVLSSSVMGWR